MIRVTIDLVPKGNEKAAKTLGVIELVNHSASTAVDLAEYDALLSGELVQLFQVATPLTPGKKIQTIRFLHPRARGVLWLLRKSINLFLSDADRERYWEVP